MIQISYEVAASLLVSFLGLVFAFGRTLLSQFEKRMNERFGAHSHAREQQYNALRGQFDTESERLRALTARVDTLWQSLPLEYVRREDWIRFSSAIDHKLDRLADIFLNAGKDRARD